MSDRGSRTNPDSIGTNRTAPPASAYRESGFLPGGGAEVRYDWSHSETPATEGFGLVNPGRATWISISVLAGILLTIGAAIRPWQQVTASDGSGSFGATGPQPWAGLALACGILILLIVVLVGLLKLPMSWAGLVAVIALAGLAFSIVATAKAGTEVQQAFEGLTGGSLGPASYLALIGSSMAFLTSIIGFFIAMSKRTDTARPVFAPASGFQGASASADQLRESNNTKRCPYCAETIKAAAVICRYCGRDLVPTSGSNARKG